MFDYQRVPFGNLRRWLSQVALKGHDGESHHLHPLQEDVLLKQWTCPAMFDDGRAKVPLVKDLTDEAVLGDGAGKFRVGGKYLGSLPI